MFYVFYCIMIIPLLILYPVVIKGKGNVPKKGRLIITCNHQTNHDGFILLAHGARRVKVMAKQELFKNKLLGWFMRCVGCYPVKRGENDITSIKQTLKYLKEEKALLIFPEGTRVSEEEAHEAKNGTAMFALRTKSPIIPCAFVKKPGFFRLNRLIYGEPYNLSEMEEFRDKPITKEILDDASEVIIGKINQIKEDYLNSRRKNVK